MSLEGVDFQALVHQIVSGLVEQWQGLGFTEEEFQENGQQFFNMGRIAADQLSKEGSIQIQETNQTIPITPEMGEKIVTYFLMGLNAAAVKAWEDKLPSNEKWQLMQNVAFHVYEQAKQVAVATLGQEHTPDVQITDDQIYEWLGGTALEALTYYVNEYEKQNGPLVREGEEQGLPELAPEEPQPQPLAEAEPQPEEIPEEQPGEPEPQPQQAAPPQAPQAPPEIHHKYAAVALLLNTISEKRQQKILSAFNPEEQQVIQQYRDPVIVTQMLDMALVAKYLKAFKEKLGESRRFGKSRYASTVAKMIQSVPQQRLNKLFQNERPYVKGYIQQTLKASQGEDIDLFELPPGVEEGLLLYLYRNFPQIAERLKDTEELSA